MQPPVSPMLAAPAHVLPTGPGWAYEPKWDGWRALAFCQPGRVYLQSRTGKALPAYFPDVTRMAAGTVRDSSRVRASDRRCTAGSGGGLEVGASGRGQIGL